MKLKTRSIKKAQKSMSMLITSKSEKYVQCVMILDGGNDLLCKDSFVIGLSVRVVNSNVLMKDISYSTKNYRKPGYLNYVSQWSILYCSLLFQ